MLLEQPLVITDSDGKILVTIRISAEGIVINDGTNDRILIGFQRDGF